MPRPDALDASPDPFPKRAVLVGEPPKIAAAVAWLKAGAEDGIGVGAAFAGERAPKPEEKQRNELLLLCERINRFINTDGKKSQSPCMAG